MYFYNDQHEQNFEAMLERFKEGKSDPEYRVGCYIVAHPEIFYKATQQEWEFLFDDWMKQDFSQGIQYLIDLGLHLYGGGSHPFNLTLSIGTWDTGNYEVFKQACEIRKGWA